MVRGGMTYHGGVSGSREKNTYSVPSDQRLVQGNYRMPKPDFPALWKPPRRINERPGYIIISIYV